MESNRIVNSARAERAVRLAPLGFLGIFFALPTVTLALDHVRWGDLAGIFTEGSTWDVAWFSLWQGTVSTALTLIVGIPATWAVTRWRFRGSHMLATAMTVPFLMPAVVMATGVAALLPSRGIIAVIWAHVAFNVSVVLRVVGPTWSRLDRDIEDGAASLGAGGWRVFRFVIWPAISDAVRNAAALVFVFCFSSFAVVSVLGGAGTRTMESEIFIQAVRLGHVDVAAALALMQAVILLAVLAAGRLRTPSIESPRDATRRDLSGRIRYRRLPAIVAVVGAGVVVAPIATLFARSVRYEGRWNLSGWRALTDGTLASVGLDVVDIICTTAAFAAICAAISVVLALSACRRPTPSIVERLSMAPLLVSSVTLGLGLIVTFDSSPFAWRAQSWLIPIVHATIALPLAVRIVGPALRTVSQEMLVSAADLGAGPLRRWRTVTLPLVRPALARAAGISAAVSIGEFGATSFLTRRGTTTVSIAIGELMGRPGPVLQQAAYALTAATAISIMTGAALIAGRDMPTA